MVNLDNSRSAIVAIVGRRPFIRGKVIDVSADAAVALGFVRAGVAHVRSARFSSGLRTPALGLGCKRRKSLDSVQSVASQGLNSRTGMRAKSAPLRVTSVSFLTIAVAAISASISGCGSGT